MDTFPPEILSHIFSKAVPGEDRPPPPKAPSFFFSSLSPAARCHLTPFSPAGAPPLIQRLSVRWCWAWAEVG
ncbi:hypothetical protein ACEPAG_8984 [Sanghuangporus baumii]